MESREDGEQIPLRRPSIPAYDELMAKAKRFELETPAPILDEEDEETLAAIDEGIRAAKAGRTVPAEEVSKGLPKWITASSTCSGR
jgi:predicted transcriptional regulator